MNINQNLTDTNFDFLDVEIEIEEPKVVLTAEIRKPLVMPEFIVAYQVRDDETKKGFDNIIDTFNCDFSRGIFPVVKAEKKANGMKRVFPKKNYYVFAIGHDKKEVQCYNTI